jgi:hypothetical protein
MDQRSTDRPPFDERAALAELERLREQIALRRRERKATSEEFDRFVKSFRNRPARTAEAAADPPAPSARRMPEPALPMAAVGPASPEARAAGFEPMAIVSDTVAIPSGPTPIPPEPIAIPPEPTAIPSEPPLTSSEAAAIPSEPIAIPQEPMATASESIPASEAPPIAPAAPQARSRARLLGGGALMLAVAGGVAAWTLRHRGPEPPAASTTLSRPTPSAPATAAPAPAVAAAEVVTSRRVWMRILADGERVLEREVPADTRLPVNALRTIVIRTGDAGAVRVTIQGRDQGVLGRAGEVVTRSFAIPAAEER